MAVRRDVGRVLRELLCAPPPGDIVRSPAPRPARPRALEKPRREARSSSPARRHSRQRVALRATLDSCAVALRGHAHRWRREAARAAVRSARFGEGSSRRRKKKSFPYLATPTQTAAEPTLPVYECRPRRCGHFHSRAPVSILPRPCGFLDPALGRPGGSRRSGLGRAAERGSLAVA